MFVVASLFLAMFMSVSAGVCTNKKEGYVLEEKFECQVFKVDYNVLDMLEGAKGVCNVRTKYSYAYVKFENGNKYCRKICGRSHLKCSSNIVVDKCLCDVEAAHPITIYLGEKTEKVGRASATSSTTLAAQQRAVPSASSKPSATPTPSKYPSPSPKPSITPTPSSYPTPSATPSTSAKPSITPTPSGYPKPALAEAKDLKTTKVPKTANTPEKFKLDLF